MKSCQQTGNQQNQANASEKNYEIYEPHKEGYLKVRAIEAATNLLEQRHHALLELCHLSDLQNLLKLTDEKHFLGAVSDRPVLQEPPDHNIRKLAILLHKLRDAIGELLMVRSRTLGLVQRNQSSYKKELMLLLQWQSKTIDNTSQNLQ